MTLYEPTKAEEAALVAGTKSLRSRLKIDKRTYWLAMDCMKRELQKEPEMGTGMKAEIRGRCLEWAAMGLRDFAISDLLDMPESARDLIMAFSYFYARGRMNIYDMEMIEEGAAAHRAIMSRNVFD